LLARAACTGPELHVSLLEGRGKRLRSTLPKGLAGLRKFLQTIPGGMNHFASFSGRPPRGSEATLNNVIDEFVRPVADALAVPLVLALGLAAIIAITHSVSWLWHVIRQRGRRPLVVVIDPTGDADDSVDHSMLNDRLLAYIAADPQRGYVIAPGAGGPAAPRVTTEALERNYGWPAAVLRLAIARQPAFLVSVNWYAGDHNGKHREHRAVVRVSRIPGDRIVASGSFTAEGEEHIIEAVGCCCIAFLRSQPRLLRYTPRWERWNQGSAGYRAYRRALDYQQRIELTNPSIVRPYDNNDYKEALANFGEAARIEPANLLVQLHRAALLELDEAYKEEAADIYERCHSLWPEHIETAYRLGNALKNNPDRTTEFDIQRHLDQVSKQLRCWSLIRNWCRTLRPWRWNPGERRYWRAWLEWWPPGSVTNRATYIRAIAVAKLLAELANLLNHGSEASASNRVTETRDSSGKQYQSNMTEILMGRLAHEILGSPDPPLLRLLHPEVIFEDPPLIHDHAWHGAEFDDVSRIPAVSGHHRRGVGWLALYNAACFLSLAIELPAKRPDLVPNFYVATAKIHAKEAEKSENAVDEEKISGIREVAEVEWIQAAEDWKSDCARAAIREIGAVVRNPQNSLQPEWLAKDKDLAALRDSPTGKAWTGFVGLSAPRNRRTNRWGAHGRLRLGDSESRR
jgi:tetratricopeptide (TPR) repeat protein